MTIVNSTLEDIPEIFRLYKLATDFQKIKFPGNLWPDFEEHFIINEINEKRQFKLLIDNKIACIWAITYNDAQIWEENDNNSSIYIHRIATNPEFRGNNFVKIIVDWSKKYAIQENKKLIRLDTCGRNDRLINHYQNCGFNFLGIKRIKDSSELPSHYHDAEVCYFEIELN